MSRGIGFLMVLLMMSAGGFAQASGNVFVGYSFNRASTGWSNTGNLNGWETSVEGKIAPIASLVADISTQYGGSLQICCGHLFGGTASVNATTRVESVMFGPRVSTTVGRFRPFAHALVGVGHVHVDALEYAHGESCVADAIGGGVDYRLLSKVGWRVQADLLQTRFYGGRQEDTRVSTGVVVNF